MVEKHKRRTEFEKIGGIKKVVRCMSCGERIIVQNFNQLKCIKCGYRGAGREAAKV